jgi:thiamine monophosphate synthase
MNILESSPSPAMPPKRPLLDLSLYLVTDSGLLPPNTTLRDHVSKAIKGGATIVQLREKKLGTRDLVNLGRELHKVTKALNVRYLLMTGSMSRSQ